MSTPSAGGVSAAEAGGLTAAAHQSHQPPDSNLSSGRASKTGKKPAGKKKGSYGITSFSHWLVVVVVGVFLLLEMAYGLCLFFDLSPQCRVWSTSLSPFFSLMHVFGFGIIVMFMGITYVSAIHYGRKDLAASAQLSEDFNELQPTDSSDTPRIKAIGICGVLVFAISGFVAHLNFAVAPEFAGFRSAVWPYLPLAKAGGYMLDFMLPLMLFPVMRHFMTWLRASPATTFLTMDASIAMHRMLGMCIFIPIALHVSMHLTWMTLLPPDAVGAPPGNIWTRAFSSYHGITGWIILCSMILMAVTSSSKVRRGKWKMFGSKIMGFDIFWNIHSLYWLAFSLLFFHSANFLRWAFWPVGLFLLDKVLRKLYKHSQTSHQFLAGRVAPNILELKVPLKHFNYKPGQWAFIRVEALSKSEWHPFTISSNPEAEEVTWHMETSGDWTSALANLVEEPCHGDHRSTRPEQPVAADDVELGMVGPGKTNKSVPAMMNRLVRNSLTPTDHLKTVNLNITVDGPYGSGSEHAFDFRKVILVSTGIGVTPFVSIMKSIHARVLAEKALGVPSRAWHVPSSIHFIHVCRSRADFNWYNPILKKLELLKVDFKPVIFVTRHVGDKALPGIPGDHRFGRPNWEEVFDETAAAIGKDAGEVGVFLCGSGAKQMQAICTSLSKKTQGTQFIFNKEVFT